MIREMLSNAELKGILERFADGTSTEQDIENVRGALLAGQLILLRDETANYIDGSVTGSVIIAGHDNLVFSVDQTQIDFNFLKKRLFPQPLGIPPPFTESIFLGRDDALSEIKCRIGMKGTNPLQKANCLVVQGVPGVGKTALVSVLARDPDVLKAFPDGVLWTCLGQSPDRISILAGWGRALGNPDLLAAGTLEEVVSEVTALLQTKRFLLIVDDVWDAAHGATFQRLRSPNSALLITTRLPKIAQSLAQTEYSIYTLPALTDESGMKLFQALAPSLMAGCRQQCLELIRYLQNHPLALHVAARLLKAEQRYGWGVGELLKSIQEGTLLIEADAPADRAEGHQLPTVSALLQKSTDRLEEQTRVCFAYLGAFASKPATLTLAAMQAVWKVPDPRPIVRELTERGLIEPIGAGSFQIHALLIKHASSPYVTHQPQDRRDALFRHAAYFAQVLSEASDLNRRGGDLTKRGLEMFRADWSNINLGQKNLISYGVGDETTAHLFYQYFIQGEELLDLRRGIKQQVHWLNVGLEVVRSHQELNLKYTELDATWLESFFLFKLSTLYARQGNLGLAGKYCQESLEISRRAQYRVGEAYALESVGSAHFSAGNISEALSYFGKALDLHRETGNAEAEASTLARIGMVYARQGNRARALDLYQKTLALGQQLNDPSRFGTLLINLASAYVDIGNFNQALELCEQDLALAREARNQSQEIAALKQMAVTYALSGDLQRAITLSQQAVALAYEIGNRQSQFDLLCMLSVSYCQSGDVQRAIIHYKEALSLSYELEDYLFMGVIVKTLTMLYWQLNQFKEAIECNEEALRVSKEMNLPDQEYEAMFSLAVSHASAGEIALAVPLYEQILSAARAAGDLQREARTLNHLAANYVRKGDVQKGIEYYGEALTVSRQIGDKQCFAFALNGLGYSSASKRLYHQSIGHYEEALPIWRELGDAANEVYALTGLALSYTELNDPRRAAEFYGLAVTHLRLLNNQIDLLNTLANLANCYIASGEPIAGLNCYNEILILGRKSGNAVAEMIALNGLGCSLFGQLQYKRGITSFEQAVEIARKVGNQSMECYALNGLIMCFSALDDTEKVKSLREQVESLSKQ